MAAGDAGHIHGRQWLSPQSKDVFFTLCYHTFCGCHQCTFPNTSFDTFYNEHIISDIFHCCKGTLDNVSSALSRSITRQVVAARVHCQYSITARGQLYYWSQERLRIIPRKPSKQTLLNFYSRLTVNEQAWNLFLLWCFYKMVINYLCSIVEYFCSFSARERCWYFLSSGLLSTLQALRFRRNQTEVCY